MSQSVAGWNTSAAGDFDSRFETRSDRGTKDERVIGEFRVEAVDTNHPAWGKVLKAIVRAGHASSLMLHESGRLSARQTVLAAFSGEQVVGHLCFRVEPARTALGSATVRAKLDSFAVADGFTGTAVEPMLKDTADDRARLMKCRGPRVEALAAC